MTAFQDTQFKIADAKQTSSFDRREFQRHHGSGMTAEHAGRTYTVSDISIGGASVIGLSAKAETRFRLVLNIGLSSRVSADCRVVSCDSENCRLAFTRPTKPLLRLIMDHINSMMHTSQDVLEADAPYMKIVTWAAEQASSVLELALQAGTVDLNALFDAAYTPIPGTNPQQHMARHTELVEILFRDLIEKPLSMASDIVFCCITDRNGYIAAHNKKYSKPQKPEDFIWNAANSRNRRVFDDRTGILAARTDKPLVQTYLRDMGGENYEVLKEMDAPIMVGGHHWGAVRMATKLV